MNKKTYFLLILITLFLLSGCNKKYHFRTSEVRTGEVYVPRHIEKKIYGTFRVVNIIQFKKKIYLICLEHNGRNYTIVSFTKENQKEGIKIERTKDYFLIVDDYVYNRNHVKESKKLGLYPLKKYLEKKIVEFCLECGSPVLYYPVLYYSPSLNGLYLIPEMQIIQEANERFEYLDINVEEYNEALMKTLEKR